METYEYRHEAIALFLDFDGTLVELAPHPDAVIVPPSLFVMLDFLQHKLEGALAIVSGRQVQRLRAFLPVSGLVIAGLHGLEFSREKVENTATIVPFPDEGREMLTHFCQDRPLVHLEDKRACMTLHYRLAPYLADECLHISQSVVERLEGYNVLPGHQAVEIRPNEASKERAMALLMKAPPFKGRIPVFIGDDKTDEEGFYYVNHHHGISIKVGKGKTIASYIVPSVSNVLELIDLLCGDVHLTAENIRHLCNKWRNSKGKGQGKL